MVPWHKWIFFFALTMCGNDKSWLIILIFYSHLLLSMKYYKIHRLVCTIYFTMTTLGRTIVCQPNCSSFFSWQWIIRTHFSINDFYINWIELNWIVQVECMTQKFRFFFFRFLFYHYISIACDKNVSSIFRHFKWITTIIIVCNVWFSIFIFSLSQFSVKLNRKTSAALITTTTTKNSEYFHLC